MPSGTYRSVCARTGRGAQATLFASCSDPRIPTYEQSEARQSKDQRRMPVSYDFLWSELGIDSGANLELRL